MSRRLEDEIKRQLDEGKPIDILEEGEIVSGDDTIPSEDGGRMNPSSGESATRLKPQRWFAWYHDNPGRLLLEKRAMQMRFPYFTLFETQQGLAWKGYLRPEGTRSYQVALIYPSNFPYSHPSVWVLDPQINAPKHQLPGGELCLMHPNDNTWQTNTTGATLIAMASTWLWCYEYHEKHCGCSEVPCEHWPGEEA